MNSRALQSRGIIAIHCKILPATIQVGILFIEDLMVIGTQQILVDTDNQTQSYSVIIPNPGYNTILRRIQ